MSTSRGLHREDALGAAEDLSSSDAGQILLRGSFSVTQERSEAKGQGRVFAAQRPPVESSGHQEPQQSGHPLHALKKADSPP